jgi:HAD superfamily hydrolase (TIGR01549 family)
VKNQNYLLLGQKFTGVIFDLDNTLVSSSLDFIGIKASLGCDSESDILDYVEALPELAQHDAKQMLVNFEMTDALSSRKLAGTDDILAILSRLNLPCAIVTRNCKQAAELKIKLNAINISLILTREDHKAKPAPDALLYIAKQWQLAPENLLYVGDYLYDIQAAQNANMMSCLLTFGRSLPYVDLATLVVHDLTELTQTIAQLSPVKKQAH